MLKPFRKTYKTRRETEIELFFKHVNWYKLLKAWGVFPTAKEAVETVHHYKAMESYIKGKWKNNPNQSLPQILNLLGILPLKYTKKSFMNQDWYFSSIQDLFDQMNLPKVRSMIQREDTYVFGIKRKYPIYFIKSK